MQKEIMVDLLNWNIRNAELNRQQNELIAERKRILGANLTKDAQNSSEANLLVLEAEWQQAVCQQDEAMRHICESFVSAFTPEYILNTYSTSVNARATHIFQKELHETLRAMYKRKYRQCVHQFQVFLEQSCAVFIQGHLLSQDKWNQEVLSELYSLQRHENITSEMQKALRKYHDFYESLYQSVSIALEQCHTKAVREYSVRMLRKEVAKDEKLQPALKQAEKGFDYTARFAKQAMLDYIPDDYANLYPAARTTERHFILHIGPTNSGKSYTALQAMRNAKDGIYLAPLRLLAYEQFDSMNKDGIYCSLKTGEERISVPGATVQSCTIEMMDERHFYDIVVIDEAQMIQDPLRGGHWTKAILGVWAKEIHVCLAPEAEQIIIRMIEQCKDTYEIIRHERFNKLVPDDVSNVHFPKRVEDGDAYIVFSRSSAHACVAQLQKRGMNPSIIYGALPYDVRQNEARRFREGETNAVVATDAIGMGLNLPIRRVVFLETEKFDGISKRKLTATEYKQIAGRAGRYGQFEKGLYVSPYQMKRAIQAINEPIPQIEFAHLLFPDTLLGVDAPLSTILRMWDGAPANEGYRKGDVTQEIQLSVLLEKHCRDKKLIYSLVSMPFDAKRTSVFTLWQEIALEYIHNHRVSLEKYIPDIVKLYHESSMEVLEDNYRQYDLLYYYAERFDQALTQRLIDERKQVSALLMRILANSKLQPKTCRKCHKPLQWNSPYNICQRCASMQ